MKENGNSFIVIWEERLVLIKNKIINIIYIKDQNLLKFVVVMIYLNKLIYKKA